MKPFLRLKLSKISHKNASFNFLGVWWKERSKKLKPMDPNDYKLTNIHYFV
jgi:hypothetical protein